jgi:TonB family protein
MALRCLLFSTDERTTAPICQVLAGLDVEAEPCSDGPAAVEKVIQQSFQIVIIDWDMQPEAGLLLSTARERKAAERPLTLAIVSDDASVPKALQAGANSILRKPIFLNQAQDTLKTARDLLRAREATASAAPAASPARPAFLKQGSESHLRAGEFLQSPGAIPGAEFVVESEVPKIFQASAAEPTSPLKELEPMAAAVETRPTPPPQPPEPGEPRGLAWYLNRSCTAPAPQTAAAAAPAPEKPELIGYDQTPSHSHTPTVTPLAEPATVRESSPEQQAREQRTEAQLFAYITGAYEESDDQRRSWLGKKVVVGALVLAAGAIVAAPQAPWHSTLRSLWTRGHQAVHAWLNPQPVTPPQAPASHENFGRPGDEYKLPVAESIPDATTDPSQIRVVPVVDPTAKKQNGPDAEGTAEPAEGAGTNPSGQPQVAPIQVQENPPAQPATGALPATGEPAEGGTVSPASAAAAAAAAKLRSDTPAASTPAVAPGLAQPAPPANPLPHSVSKPPATPGIPSSLKSQMASMTPDASGNKPVETALPSIEPVDIPEATARSLLTEQPAPLYPANAKGQQGTVVLQLLIGRDGTVQDAKFLQGSLAFARAAIEGVKLWKFKPYIMNGRPVSVQTRLTLNFKPGS